MLDLTYTISNQKETISLDNHPNQEWLYLDKQTLRVGDQFEIDEEESKFLKMNLYYGHKCRRSFFNTKGFTVGSDEYKNCVLNKGRKN